jgi:outer membrane protein TolC
VRSLIHLLVLLASGAADGLALTEDEAVERGLTQPRVTSLLEARRAAAEGTASSVGRWENPELEYSEESLDLPGGDSTDQFLWFRQRLNIAGARGLERRAARLNLTGQYARIEIQRRELIREIRVLYYDALAAEEVLAALSEWRGRLEELAAAVDARLEAGDAARYDQMRLRRELALVRADVLEAEAELESAQEALFGLIGGERGAMAGQLLPPPVSVPLERIADDHLLLQALEAEGRSAEARARAARRAAWPDVTVGVGRRELDEPAIDAEGGLFAIAIEVPLFDRNQGQAKAARNEAKAIEAERSLARTRLISETREAIRLLDVRRDAALALEGEGAGAESSLAAIAEAAYGAGEIDVMALIDAHRTELSIERRATDLARAARAAFIQLQYLSGQM